MTLWGLNNTPKRRTRSLCWLWWRAVPPVVSAPAVVTAIPPTVTTAAALTAAAAMRPWRRRRRGVVAGRVLGRESMMVCSFGFGLPAHHRLVEWARGRAEWFGRRPPTQCWRPPFAVGTGWCLSPPSTRGRSDTSAERLRRLGSLLLDVVRGLLDGSAEGVAGGDAGQQHRPAEQDQSCDARVEELRGVAAAAGDGHRRAGGKPLGHGRQRWLQDADLDHEDPGD